MSVAVAVLALTVIALLVISYRYPWWRPGLSLTHPRILCYHMIADRPKEARAPRLAVSPRRFERQIRYLLRNGWQFVTMSELLDNPLSAKTVALTFDDGYRDNLIEVAPILKRYGVCATVYVIAERSQPLSGGGYEDGRPFAPLMTDMELRRLTETGTFEIGSHTMSHRDLTAVDDTVALAELTESRAALEALTGAAVRGFAYPYGAFEERLVSLVEQAGYEHAVRGVGLNGNLDEDRYRLARLRISGKDSFLNFVMKIEKGRKR